MWRFGSKHKAVEGLWIFTVFFERYQQLLDADSLSDKQKAYYREKKELLGKELQGFHH